MNNKLFFSIIFSLSAIVLSSFALIKRESPSESVKGLPTFAGFQLLSIVKPGLVMSDGVSTSTLFASSSPVFSSFSATSTTATSTFAYGLNVGSGCIAFSGTCLLNINLLTATNTWTGINTFSTSTATSTNIGSSPAYWIGKTVTVFSSTGTSTFSVPSGINKVYVRLVGGGGGGAGESGAGSAGGGQAGAYSEGYVDITGTTSIQVFVGAAGALGAGGGANSGAPGTWSTFGTNGFYIQAAGGLGGTGGVSGAAGTGATASGGFLNVPGGKGCDGTTISSQPCGGSSYFGSLGAYGSGGRGGFNGNNADNGTQGIIIVSW